MQVRKNFDAEIGRKIARQNAVNKIWMLEGYLLKQKLSESNNTVTCHKQPADELALFYPHQRISAVLSPPAD